MGDQLCPGLRGPVITLWIRETHMCGYTFPLCAPDRARIAAYARVCFICFMPNICSTGTVMASCLALVYFYIFVCVSGFETCLG